MDEHKLISGLKKGDYASYQTLFREYYARFVRFSDSIIKDLPASKDIVQEAFVKVWLNRDKLDETKSIKNYLFVLVKRAVLNFLRDRKFARQLTEVQTLPGGQYAEGLLSELTASAGSEADAAAQRRQIERLARESIDSMPEKRKEVYRLSREQGLSNEEIARQMNISPKTVERHITLALKDIRKNLS